MIGGLATDYWRFARGKVLCSVRVIPEARVLKAASTHMEEIQKVVFRKRTEDNCSDLTIIQECGSMLYSSGGKSLGKGW